MVSFPILDRCQNIFQLLVTDDMVNPFWTLPSEVGTMRPFLTSTTSLSHSFVTGSTCSDAEKTAKSTHFLISWGGGVDLHIGRWNARNLNDLIHSSITRQCLLEKQQGKRNIMRPNRNTEKIVRQR